MAWIWKIEQYKFLLKELLKQQEILNNEAKSEMFLQKL